MRGSCWQEPQERQAVLHSIRRAAQETISPLERLENTWHPWLGGMMLLFGCPGLQRDLP